MAEFLRYNPSSGRCVFCNTSGSNRDLTTEEQERIATDYSSGWGFAERGVRYVMRKWQRIGYAAFNGRVDDYGELDAAVLGGLVPDPNIRDRDPMHGHDPVSGLARND